MEDFIYILIGVAWIAYSIYNQGQKQKRKQQAQSEVKSEEELPGIEQKLQSFLDKKLNMDNLFDFEEKTEEYLDSPYSEIDVVEEKDESTYFKAETEGVSAFEVEPESKIEEEVTKIEESDEFEITDGIITAEDEFDLKKAVIYSEILNPPYIKY